jgi:hypothetical protein
VTMHSTGLAGITVTANAGTSGAVSIVFKPGATFAILNTMPSTETTPPHFLAYYLMGVGSGTCTSVPSDGPPCAAQTTECVVTKKQTTKAVTSAVRKKRPPVTAIVTEIDMDCSNSHFP